MFDIVFVVFQDQEITDLTNLPSTDLNEILNNDN